MCPGQGPLSGTQGLRAGGRCAGVPDRDPCPGHWAVVLSRETVGTRGLAGGERDNSDTDEGAEDDGASLGGAEDGGVDVRLLKGPVDGVCRARCRQSMASVDGVSRWRQSMASVDGVCRASTIAKVIQIFYRFYGDFIQILHSPVSAGGRCSGCAAHHNSDPRQTERDGPSMWSITDPRQTEREMDHPCGPSRIHDVGVGVCVGARK